MSELIEARRKAFEVEYPNLFGYEWRDGAYFLPEQAKYKRPELNQHQMYLYAFRWFCKALDSVVVELPKQYDIGGMACDSHDRAIAICAEAIHAAGIKIKGAP